MPSHNTTNPTHPNPNLRTLYSWTHSPFICSAPMRLISTAPLAVAVTLSGGLGFIGAGSDISSLDAELTHARRLLCEAGWPGLGTRPSASAEGSEETGGELEEERIEGEENKRKGQETDQTHPTLPIGVGFLAWGISPHAAAPILRKHRPAAIWLFAPRDELYVSLREWVDALQPSSSSTYTPHIWVQTGTITEALSTLQTLGPALTVLVMQGQDAGGHGLARCASIISLVPETVDALRSHSHLQSATTNPASESTAPSPLHTPLIVAAGGIADGRGVAAALALGAAGACLGTRYLAASEANVSQGYRDAVLHGSDGGASTVRTKLYDTLRGTTQWPERYGGRGMTNASWDNFVGGAVTEEENKRLYDEAVKMGDAGWGPMGRMTTYAGTAVGLVRKLQSTREITEEVREECRNVMRRLSHKL